MANIEQLKSADPPSVKRGKGEKMKYKLTYFEIV